MPQRAPPSPNRPRRPRARSRAPSPQPPPYPHVFDRTDRQLNGFLTADHAGAWQLEDKRAVRSGRGTAGAAGLYMGCKKDALL